jgi:hypothetical protein
MLAYLEDLCGALIAHDTDAIQRLLAHPLARSLPRQVREEAIAISRASAASLRAPIQTLRFYHQTLQLGAPGQETPAGEGEGEGEGESGVADSSDAEPDRGSSRVVKAGDPYGREVRGEAHARDVQRPHATGREQIELPLEPPRKAQAA